MNCGCQQRKEIMFQSGGLGRAEYFIISASILSIYLAKRYGK